MTIEQIAANLPKNMHPIDKEQYLKVHKEIIDINTSGLNKHMLEPLKNYAFRIICPYITNQFSITN